MINGDFLVSIKDFAKIVNVAEKVPYKFFKSQKDDEAPLIEPIKVGSKKFLLASSVYNFRKKRNSTPKLGNNVKKIAIYNAKGGEGKTMISFNLGIRFAMIGMRVLCIDMDMQANLTTSFGITQPKDHLTFLNVFEESASFDDAIIHITPTLDLLPSNISLGSLNQRVDFTNGVDLFSNIIKKIEHHYDVIIIDCGPSISNINFAVICAADKVITPVTSNTLSKDGLDMTINQIAKANKFVSPLHEVIINNIDLRQKTHQEHFAQYTTNYKQLVLPTIIRQSADLNTSLSMRKSIFDYNLKCGAAQDFSLLASNLIGEEFKTAADSEREDL